MGWDMEIHSYKYTGNHIHNRILWIKNIAEIYKKAHSHVHGSLMLVNSAHGMKVIV